MAAESTSTIFSSFYKDLNHVKELVYDKCGLSLTNLKLHSESAAYGACSFLLNGKKIQYRASKATSTKTGQFVTLWKRGKDGKTMPFDLADDIDCIIITARSGTRLGQFVLPKSVLADKGIIARNGKGGKRGIRVYAPWDIAANKQAEKTQSWQAKYFLTIKDDSKTDLDLAKELFVWNDEKRLFS